MDDTALLNALTDLRIPSPIGEETALYIEVGTLKGYRVVGFNPDEGGWYYADGRFFGVFHCTNLREALECLISPPSSGDWEENIADQREPT